MAAVLGTGAAWKFAVERRAFRRADVARRKLPRTRVDRRRRALAFATIAVALGAIPAYRAWDSRNRVDVVDLRPGDCVATTNLWNGDLRRTECDAAGVVRFIAVRGDATDADEWERSCRRAFELGSRDRNTEFVVQIDGFVPSRVDRESGRLSTQFQSVVQGTEVCGAYLWEIAAG